MQSAETKKYPARVVRSANRGSRVPSADYLLLVRCILVSLMHRGESRPDASVPCFFVVPHVTWLLVPKLSWKLCWPLTQACRSSVPSVVMEATWTIFSPGSSKTQFVLQVVVVLVASLHLVSLMSLTQVITVQSLQTTSLPLKFCFYFCIATGLAILKCK